MRLKMADGSEVEAERVDFKTVKEDWNIYELIDGTIIRTKNIVVEIYRLESIDPATGQHNYFVRHSTTVNAIEKK